MQETKHSFFRKHLSLIIIFILAIALVATVGYMLYTKMQATRALQLQQAVQQAANLGANQGIEQTVATLFQQTDNCQKVTLYFGNLTRQVIDFACPQPRQ